MDGLERTGVPTVRVAIVRARGFLRNSGTERTLLGGGVAQSWKDVEMDDILTIAEMESRFIAEWLLVEYPQLNDALEVHSGVVRYHSKDRDEVYRKALELRPKQFAVLYTGEIPKDSAVVL